MIKGQIIPQSIVVKSVRLECTTGGHDKVYEVSIYDTNQNFRWEVWAAYGKRTGNLRKILKGTWRLWGSADNQFLDLIYEKTQKGYKHTVLGKTVNLSTPEGKKEYAKLVTSNIEKIQEKIASKPFAPMFILPKKDATTVTIDRETYEKLLAGQINIPVSMPEIKGRKFRDE